VYHLEGGVVNDRGKKMADRYVIYVMDERNYGPGPITYMAQCICVACALCGKNAAFNRVVLSRRLFHFSTVDRQA